MHKHLKVGTKILYFQITQKFNHIKTTKQVPFYPYIYPSNHPSIHLWPVGKSYLLTCPSFWSFLLFSVVCHKCRRVERINFYGTGCLLKRTRDSSERRIFQRQKGTPSFNNSIKIVFFHFILGLVGSLIIHYYYY